MRNALFRRVLWVAAGFNMLAAGLLAFPGSAAGQLAGLPADVPLAYRGVVAVFVLLFAGSYVWLALQPEPDRPMVVMAAIGKMSVVILVTVLWLAAEATITTLATASSDLVFALLFAGWLRSSRAGARRT